MAKPNRLFLVTQIAEMRPSPQAFGHARVPKSPKLVSEDHFSLGYRRERALAAELRRSR